MNKYATLSSEHYIIEWANNKPWHYVERKQTFAMKQKNSLFLRGTLKNFDWWCNDKALGSIKYIYVFQFMANPTFLLADCFCLVRLLFSQFHQNFLITQNSNWLSFKPLTWKLKVIQNLSQLLSCLHKMSTSLN